MRLQLMQMYDIYTNFLSCSNQPVASTKCLMQAKLLTR